MLTLDSHFRWTMKSQTAGNGGTGKQGFIYGRILREIKNLVGTNQICVNFWQLNFADNNFLPT